MRLVLSMTLDDNASSDSTVAGDILYRLGETVTELTVLSPGMAYDLVDRNGNAVGTWEVIEGPTCPLCDAPLTHEGASCPNQWLSAHH